MFPSTSPAAASPYAGGAVPPEADLHGLARAVWARKMWILVPTLLVLALTLVVLTVMTPTYTSEGQILVEIRENTYTRSSQEGGPADRGAILDVEAIRSQVQLLHSRDVARSVVESLDLAAHPEFAPGRSLVGQVLGMLGLSDGGPIPGDERVLQAFAERLDVFPIEETRVIVVQFTAADPELAARVVDAMLNRFLALQREAKREATLEATQWLAAEIEDLRAKVQQADAQMQAFRSRTGLLLGANNTPLSLQELSELNAQLIAAESRQAEAQARAAMLRSLLASGVELDTAGDVLQSPLIGRLQERLVNLQAQQAELSSTLLPGHPRMRELRAQIEGLRTQIRAEVQKIVASLENEAEIAGAQQAAARGRLDAMKERVSASSDDEVQLRALEREAVAQRNLLETLLARYRDADARADLGATPADARVISRPSAATLPSSPKPMPILLAGTVLTFLLALVLVVTRALMAQVPQSPIPAAPRPVDPSEGRGALWRIHPGDKAAPEHSTATVLDYPAVVASAAALEEALLPAIEAGRRRFMITTAKDPGHSRSVAVMLGERLHEAGRRTIVLDAQFRTGQIEDGGLAGLLSGTTEFDKAIELDAESGLDMIRPGRGRVDPVLLAGSDRLAAVLASLEEAYEAVLIAAEPINVAPDARLMTQQVGTVVLLAPHGLADRATIRARDYLRDFARTEVVTFCPASGAAPDEPDGPARDEVERGAAA